MLWDACVMFWMQCFILQEMWCIMCAFLGFVCKVLKKTKRQSFENACKQVEKTVICIFISVKVSLASEASWNSPERAEECDAELCLSGNVWWNRREQRVCAWSSALIGPRHPRPPVRSHAYRREATPMGKTSAEAKLHRIHSKTREKLHISFKTEQY